METAADPGARSIGASNLDNIPPIPLDMDAIARMALRPKSRTWRVTFDFAGTPFVCTVEAETEKGAYTAAIEHLVLHRVDVPEDSRMASCIEVSA